MANFVERSCPLRIFGDLSHQELVPDLPISGVVQMRNKSLPDRMSRSGVHDQPS